jgi:hypothetical protein
MKHVFTVGEIIKTKTGHDTLLTYLGEGTRNRQRKVKVRCKCGKEWEAQVGNIMNGTTVCCGKYPCRTYKNLYQDKRDPEVGYRSLFYTYKRHASERNLEFHLTYEEFKNLLQQKCHYCDTPPSQIYRITKPGTDEVRTGVPILYNGIDRIDSSVGYTLDNTLTACKHCNKGKMEQTYDQFLQMVIKIYNNLNLKEYVPPTTS